MNPTRPTEATTQATATSAGGRSGGLDDWTQRGARWLARRSSRRGVLARLGALVLGGAAFPLLPVGRAAAGQAPPDGAMVPPASTGNPDDPGNPRSCDYWRYCGIDGFLCACCGGTTSSCPPGAQMSPITWIGTCQNPADHKHYIITYNDCCGKNGCKRCYCNHNEREEPEYRPQKNNEIHWCLGVESNAYTCSVAVIVGTALEEDAAGGA